jgi:spore coat polysaccharide biosynthesis protein SpsF
MSRRIGLLKDSMMHNKSASGAIVIARMDSSRFPGKAMTHLGGKPIIERCIGALKGSDEFITLLATTGREVDRPLVDFAEHLGFEYFQGSYDISERIAGCIRKFGLQYFARVNGDSPFTRRELLTEGFRIIREKNLDFVTNLVPRAFPYGISVEIMKSEKFLSSLPDLNTDYYREHVTTYFYEHFGTLKTYCMPYTSGNDHDVKLVVDTYEDKECIEKMLTILPNAFELPISEIVKLYRGVHHD